MADDKKEDALKILEVYYNEKGWPGIFNLIYNLSVKLEDKNTFSEEDVKKFSVDILNPSEEEKPKPLKNISNATFADNSDEYFASEDPSIYDLAYRNLAMKENGLISTEEKVEHGIARVKNNFPDAKLVTPTGMKK